jgi:aldose 1-epimerase
VKQLRIAAGPLEVVVLPAVGARLHRLRAFGQDLLRTPADPAIHRREPFAWGAYVMAPWCNRIAAGRVEVEGRIVALTPNHVDGSVLHGQVSASEWQVEATGPTAVACRVSAGGDGWPWTYAVWQQVEVLGSTVRVRQRLTNTSPWPMPAGLGLHPWFRQPVEVAIRAAAVHPSNVDPEPHSTPRPVDGPFDRRAGGPMPVGLDATWTTLDDPPVELAWPAAGLRATLRTSPPLDYIVAASLPGLDAVAVEPQTHAPQGLRRLLRGEPGGLAVLPPGGEISHAIRIEVERE